ncbi:hypothetical protein AB0B50_16265 [Streptomyces sp. NPDC041068]|uniref:hypothetical protein n=1 Tax=Streptomyces sp. NPDC041068 TaxID=3155130 RepID=UPI00340DB0F7
MGAPPQHRANAAQHAERNARIFELKLAGLTERQIGNAVGLSQPRVNEIISELVAERVTPPAEQYVQEREDELQDLYAKAYRSVLTAKDTDARSRAITTCARINESRRKLRGADAAQSITVRAEANLDLTAELVTATILSTLDDLMDALPGDLPAPFRADLREWTLMRAQAHISAEGYDDGPVPAPPRPMLALPPGSAEGGADAPAPRGGPPGPAEPQQDGVGAVMAALSALEDEFPGVLREDSDDGSEEDQAQVAGDRG